MNGLGQNLQKHILYIPGTSGFKDMDRIDYLDAKAQEAGFSFSFLQTWNNNTDLQSKTLRNIIESIDSTITTLTAETDEIYVVAKSFGAGIMLLRTWPQISKMVLWSPTVGLSYKNSFGAIQDTPLEKLSSIFDITTDIETLGQIETPILVIRGTQDDVIALASLQLIIKNLPHGEFKELQSMGHSPKTEQEMEFLTAHTIQFLK